MPLRAAWRSRASADPRPSTWGDRCSIFELPEDRWILQLCQLEDHVYSRFRGTRDSRGRAIEIYVVARAEMIGNDPSKKRSFGHAAPRRQSDTARAFPASRGSAVGRGRSPFRNGAPNSLSAAAYHHLPPFITGAAVRGSSIQHSAQKSDHFV
jgi:hypothetical protein